MSEPLSYPVPFQLLARELTQPILESRRADVARVYEGFVARMHPEPEYCGLENLPSGPRFVLAANHFQRKGLWIAHAASAIAVALARCYGTNPPVRWVVTANWPRWKLGPLEVRSPGDILLPRVAHAVWCYAVPFAGTNPATTARSLRRLLKDAARLDCTVGLFPEGAHAVAGQFGAPLPGVGRFISLMASQGWPVLPVHVSERGRFVVRFGQVIGTGELLASDEPGLLVMRHIQDILQTK